LNIARLAVKRPVFVVMIVASILTLGALGYMGMGIDLLPDVEFPTITVAVIYAGASAEEIESLITKPMEDALATLEGLDTLLSSSQEGVSYVTARFGLGTDIKYAETKVREKVDLVKLRLPEDSEEPKISRFSMSDIPVALLAIYGRKNLADLREIIEEDVKPEIEKISGVGKVEIWGGRERAVKIIINRAVLNARAIALNSVIEAVKKENLNYPVGTIKSEERNVIVRVVGRFSNIEDIENIPVKTFTGQTVRIKDIAEVKLGLTEETRRTRFNKKNAVMFSVFKQSGENTVEVAKRVIKRIEELSEALPEGMSLNKVRDTSVHIEQSVKGLQEDILLGALCAILIVWLFLGNFRSTIITAVALPNSLIGAFFLVSLSGFTINMMILMALSLSIGLLIDDSIVVRENIFRYMEKGLKPKEAAEKGTNEVGLAVIATTTSIMAVFIPISFLEGVVGQFFKEFGLTVAFALLISLIDAFTTAPMLSAYWWKKDKKDSKGIAKTAKNLSLKWNHFYNRLNSVYTDILKWALNRKKRVVTGALVLFLSSFVFINFVGMSFLPDTEYDFFEIDLESYPGVPLEKFDKSVSKLEDYVMQLKEFKSCYASAGGAEQNKAWVFVNLVKEKERKRKRKEISADVINYVKKNFGKEVIVYEVPTGSEEAVMGGGETAPLIINITGDEMDMLERISREIKKAVQETTGVTDVKSTYSPGKPEVVIRLDRVKAAEQGISSHDTGVALNMLLKGAVISKYMAGEKEYDIIMQLDEKGRDEISDLKGIMLTNREGQKIPLSAVCSMEYSSGPVVIKRENKRKIIKVTANLKEGYALGDTINRAKKRIEENIKIPGGYVYEFGGQATSLNETVREMTKAGLLAILFMYMILASLYNSFIQPLILMLSVPLAIIGAVLALLVTGMKMDVMAMIGILMVLGLVAKNGILLIDFANQKRKEGMKARDALLFAGPVRLRPILMTTFAMIAGMMPLALGFGENAMRTQAMPIAVIGGLLTSTFLTLVVIPVVYELYENYKDKRGKKPVVKKKRK